MTKYTGTYFRVEAKFFFGNILRVDQIFCCLAPGLSRALPARKRQQLECWRKSRKVFDEILILKRISLPVLFQSHIGSRLTETVLCRETTWAQRYRKTDCKNIIFITFKNSLTVAVKWIFQGIRQVKKHQESERHFLTNLKPLPCMYRKTEENL